MYLNQTYHYQKRIIKQHMLGLVFMFWCCGAITQAQDRPHPQLELQHDSLTLDVRGVQTPGCYFYISHLADFDGHWYVTMTERDPQPHNTDWFRLFVFNRSGELLRELPLPDVVRKNTIYLDLYVQNDQLHLLPYMHNRSYRFDLKKDGWLEYRKRSNQVYEDERYRVYYRDYGEWGSCTWFIDKKTKKQYITPYSSDRMTRFQGKYYLDYSSALSLIADPRDLLPCPPAYRYQKRRRPAAFPPVEPQGETTIWADTTEREYYSFDTSRLGLHRSWVANGQLLHVINDSTRLLVAKYSGNEWIPLLDLGPKRIYSRWHNAYRGLNPNDSSRLLEYGHSDNVHYTVLQIKGELLHLQKWTLLYDTLLYQHTPNWQGYFELLSGQIADFKRVNELEAFRGSTNMQKSRQGTGVGYYLPIQNPPVQQFTQMHRAVIDSILTIKTEHVFRASDSVWLGCRLEFVETQPYLRTGLQHIFADRKPITQYMAVVQEQLMEALNTHFGPVHHIEPAGKGRLRSKWITPRGGQLVLEGRNEFEDWPPFSLKLIAYP